MAIVTGGADGIGLAVATRLAQEGARVVIADIDEEAGEEAVGDLRQGGSQAEAIRVAVAKEADAEKMVAFTERRFGGLDILVNNAGGMWGPSFPECTPKGWGRVLDVNLRGVMLATQLALPAMRRRGGGAIVNMASMAGVGTLPHADPEYAAAKAGVVRFTTTLAPLSVREGIRVNAICPGWVEGP
ncbi:SDR family NAD(P)-dependent oxidoreductase [Limnochorda pilosa]|uniref:SDR family NAD(P)-dependent oxidoreductase n=1 Tax=Limnochorda pilosa TaxID=1555112 RepID=UPI00130DD7C8|nr:SDR family oxidoreductase [Limnochorda pilosa]